LPWLKGSRSPNPSELPYPEWAHPPSTDHLDVSPDSAESLLVAARHATSVESGLTISVLATRPLEAVAYGLIGIGTEYFRSLVRQFCGPSEQSEPAIAMRAVSAALTGDLGEARARVAEAEKNGPARSMVAAILASIDQDHESAGALASGWIDCLPADLGAPTAAAAIALVLDQRGDVKGRTYWADVLLHMMPNSMAVLSFAAECHSLLAKTTKSKQEMRHTLDLRRRAVFGRPMHVSTRERFVSTAEAVGPSHLEPPDRALMLFLGQGGPAPPHTFWERPLGCWCSAVTDLIGTPAEESSVTHLQVLQRYPPIAVARCRHTEAAWILVAPGTLKKENGVRNLRLPNVSFSDPPPPDDDDGSSLKRGHYL
jgi:hypothetical protein